MQVYETHHGNSGLRSPDTSLPHLKLLKPSSNSIRLGKRMRIHGLCVVKNEFDVIEQSLAAAAKWCDRIYVLDNGSTDGTWETVLRLAHELPAIVPYKQDCRPFDDSIRAHILRHYQSEARPGDWWCVLDADEFCLDDPQSFLCSVPRPYNLVWMEMYNYLFTDRDLAVYLADPNAYHRVPVQQRLRYFMLSEYSEPRFFRHSARLRAVPTRDDHPIYPRRIRMKHYAYRSPQQIQVRLDTRREAMIRGEFLHEKRSNWVPGGVIVPGPAKPNDMPQSWEERVTPSAECHYDAGDGIYSGALNWTPPRRPAWPETVRSRLRSLLKRARSAYRWLLTH